MSFLSLIMVHVAIFLQELLPFVCEIMIFFRDVQSPNLSNFIWNLKKHGHNV